MAEGATVTAYVEAPLCAGAQRELAGEGGRAGEVEVRVACLASAGDGGRLDLARVGANARRASEDSTTVAYLEAPDPANRFSRPILDAASIPRISSDSGAAAMTQLLKALADADPSSLRDSVREALDES